MASITCSHSCPLSTVTTITSRALPRNPPKKGRTRARALLELYGSGAAECWALGIDAGGGDWATSQESSSLRQQGHAARWGRERLVLGQEELFARTAQASAKLALIKMHEIKH